MTCTIRFGHKFDNHPALPHTQTHSVAFALRAAECGKDDIVERLMPYVQDASVNVDLIRTELSSFEKLLCEPHLNSGPPVPPKGLAREASRVTPAGPMVRTKSTFI